MTDPNSKDPAELEPTPESTAETQPVAAARPEATPPADTEPLADTLILPRPAAKAGLAGMPLHYYLLWLVALASLALNAFVIKTLLDVRQQAGIAFEDAASAMGAIQAGTIEYTVQIDERIPVALDVPVQFTVDIPVKRTLPIQTVVDVPIEFPLIGTRVINIPISTTVALDFVVQVPVDESIPVNGLVPVRFAVPINLKIAETTFGEGIGDFKLVLEQQADLLRGQQ